MATCFIFVKHLNEEGCLSLSLDDQGNLIEPLQQRTFAAIQLLQKSAKTMVVVPAEHFGFYSVELPWLADKKARAALPFALEDQLAENVEHLHFAFDKLHYHLGHYLVVVCKKSYLKDITKKLEAHEISFNFLTVDWFALASNEACLFENSLLINNLSFLGALAPEFVSLYLKQLLPEQILYSFAKNHTSIELKSSTLIEEDPYVWIAKRLLTHHPINLYQGEFQPEDSGDHLKKWYWAAGSMLGLWLGSFFLMSGISLYQLNTQTKQTDAKIAQIYKQFFPKDQQVISPRFRIEQLLKANQGNKDTAFWLLLNHLATALKNNSSNIQQIKYQTQSLQVTVESPDFNTLEQLENSLQKAGVSLKQMQASTREKKVISILELKL